MANCGTVLKSALVALVLVAVIQSASAAEKLATCCKKVNREEITQPITGYMVQKASLQCVRAVIFQTAKGLFCSQITAPWVRRKIIEFEKAKAQATPSSVVPSSTASLLSIITSTASPPSSSTPIFSSSSPPPSPSSLPPFSPTPPPSSSSLPSPSDLTAGETFSENDDE